MTHDPTSTRRKADDEIAVIAAIHRKLDALPERARAAAITLLDFDLSEAELAILGAVGRRLAALDPAARRRVIAWCGSRYRPVEELA